MSLLLDALKKAAAAKQAQEAGHQETQPAGEPAAIETPDQAGELSLAPVDAAPEDEGEADEREDGLDESLDSPPLSQAFEEEEPDLEFPVASDLEATSVPSDEQSEPEPLETGGEAGSPPLSGQETDGPINDVIEYDEVPATDAVSEPAPDPQVETDGVAAESEPLTVERRGDRNDWEERDWATPGQRAQANAVLRAEQNRQRRRRLLVWGTLGTVVLIGAGGYGVYAYRALQPGQTGPAQTFIVQQGQPSASAPAPQPQPPAATEAPQAVAAPKPPVAEPVQVHPKPPAVTHKPAKPAVPSTHTITHKKPVRKAARPKPAKRPIVVREEGGGLSGWLNKGYAAFQQGDFQAAEAAYREAYRIEPSNRDALLGMGASTAALGDREAAQQYYRTLLHLNPQDAIAKAALSSLEGALRPTHTLAELQRLIAGQPDSAPLRFALGNLYAAESSWAQAVQAYGEAVSLESSNPDYLFNLAVAQDHLGHLDQALQNYRRAEVAALTHPSLIDRSILRERIRAIEALRRHAS
ncbi:MAG: tetratricopeptide repeat protein [Gammaproteobacteria bacterium]